MAKEPEKKEKRMDEEKLQKILKIGIGIAAGVLVVGGIGMFAFFNKAKKDDNTAETTTVATEPSVNDSEAAAKLEEMKKVVDDPNFYEGISINGVSVAGKSKDEVKQMFASDSAATLDIKFQVRDEQIPLNTGDVKILSDINSVINKAYNYGRTSSFVGDEAIKDRYAQIVALKITPVDFCCTYKLGTSSTDIDSLVRQTLEPYNTEVAEASVEGFDVEKLEFVYVESQDGVVIDIDKAIADVKAALNNLEYQVVIPVSAEITEPQVSTEFLKSQLGLVSTTTSETTDNDNRNTNIRLVCEKLDGLVLQPGEKFNFNDYIGRRTAEGGYKPAHGIYNGSMRDEIGGGICQANTMLYQSVSKADLQVDERKNHSIPSTYVPKGTDATVTWYSPNFRFTNNTDYPIAIHAYYKDLHVTVEIYGRQLPDGQHIELVGEQVSTIGAGTTYVSDPSLPEGTQKKVSSGRTGYVYKSYKVWYDKDGNEVKRDAYFPSTYPAKSAIIHVGTGGGGGTVDPNTGDVTPDESTDPTAPGQDPTTPPNDNPPVTPEGGNEGGNGEGGQNGGSEGGNEGGNNGGGSEGGNEGGNGGGSEGGQNGGSEGGNEGGNNGGGSGSGGGSEGGGSEGGSGGGSEGGGSEGGGEGGA